jgi:hypothetical protein
LSAFAHTNRRDQKGQGRRPKTFPQDIVQRPDAEIEKDVLYVLAGRPGFDSSKILVKTYAGDVILSGEVRSELTRRSAEFYAERVQGVKKVVDNLVLGNWEEPPGEVTKSTAPPPAQKKAADSVPRPYAVASFLGRIGRQLWEATEPVSPSNAVSAMETIPDPGRSGVLHYEGPAMHFGGHVVFSNLPHERLGLPMCGRLQRTRYLRLPGTCQPRPPRHY